MNSWAAWEPHLKGGSAGAWPYRVVKSGPPKLELSLESQEMLRI
jgi:hypothetical protein